jgi:2'-5' RNA ligase
VRLFVAIALPDDVRSTVAARVSALHRSAPDGLRWAAPERWHLTLCFLGEVPDGRVAAVESSVGRKVARHGALSLRLAGAGRFGRRVLWVGVGGDVEPLTRLSAAVAAGARRAHVDVEDRPYRAHLTVARADGRADLAPLASALAGVESPAWTADEVILVRSRLGPHPSHEPLASWRLRAAGSPAAPT